MLNKVTAFTKLTFVHILCRTQLPHLHLVILSLLRNKQFSLQGKLYPRKLVTLFNGLVDIPIAFSVQTVITAYYAMFLVLTCSEPPAASTPPITMTPAPAVDAPYAYFSCLGTSIQIIPFDFPPYF